MKPSEVSAEAGPTWFVARFIEYGTSKMPPRSFAEPAALAATPRFIENLLDAGDLTQKRRTRPK